VNPVAVKTPLRLEEPVSELLRESLAPIGHSRPPLVSRGRMIWSIVMLVVLVVALAIGIVLQLRSSDPTPQEDRTDQIEVPAASDATGVWEDLLG
jgi:hypothetical protein